jgi:dTDP-4-dehydrorhamnose reductase
MARMLSGPLDLNKQKTLMKILVTGSNGQLGNEIRELSAVYPLYEFMYTDVNELDITDASQVNQFFALHSPDAVINCAAYTAVDKAETDEETAYLVNAAAPGNLARSAAESGAFMVHISTDYVYDGKMYRPYAETDKTKPISVYARSKAAGEEAVLQAKGKAVIIRTSWLYSAFGNNFIKTIMKYGAEREMLNVVFDQTGTPTYARDLAKTILDILPLAMAAEDIEVYHYSNEGVASWYDFAKAIVEIAGIDCRINAIGTKDYPLPAARPFYSVLDKSKIKKKFSIEIPYWKDSVKRCIQRLK